MCVPWQDNPSSTIWIAGDFNLPNIEWEIQTVRGHNYPIELCKTFTTFLSDSDGRLPTRLTNILNLFITNMPSLKPLPGISDHEIVFVELLTNIELQNSTRTCKLWHKADMDSIHEVITNFNNEFLHCNTDTPVDALWNKFKDMCHVCLNKIPSKL